MINTPVANRLHIGIYGAANSGKSTLVNTVTGQQISIVSEYAGTTTDPVSKAIEFPGIGACNITDTAGYNDNGILGGKRTEATLNTLAATDIALVVLSSYDEDKEFVGMIKEKNIRAIYLINEGKNTDEAKKSAERLNVEYISIDFAGKEARDEIIKAITRLIPEGYDTESIVGHLVNYGDTVMLVMPQDESAPKRRLILPQVQTIRELLDSKCIVVCTTPDTYIEAVKSIKPKLIIVDSQVFPFVEKNKPEGSLLTSFSVLFARYKGNIDEFVKGAKAMDMLGKNAKILIAEACTHAPVGEDIGTVKIPALLRKRYGDGITVTNVSGKDFPRDLGGYDLIIHCGACMFNRKYVLMRQEEAKKASVPMTNYGIAIAYLTGILDKVVY